MTTKKITKRDLFIFFLGMFTFIAVESIFNWEDTKNTFVKGFKDGWNEFEVK